MKCQIFRQLLALFVLPALLASTSQAAELCRQIYIKPSVPVSRAAFEYNDGLSIQENLAAFARDYGIGINWQGNLFPEFPTRYFSSLRGFSGSDAKPAPDGVKQSMTFGGSNSTNDSPKIELPPIFHAHLPDAELMGERWIDGSRQYRFFNIGSRLLLKGASPEKLMALSLKAAKENPDRQIEIPLDPTWALLRQVLNERQAVASQKGIRNYPDKKPYLEGEDLYDLVFHDEVAKNSNDFMVLLKETGKDPLTLTAEEFGQNLAAIFRVARLSDFDNWLMPYVLGGWSLNEGLPHTQRLRPELKALIQLFLRELSQRGLRIGELSRLNRFDNFSDAMMDALLMKMFQVANTPGAEIDLLLLECDARTARLFEKKGFHFKTLARISPDGQKVPEYLQYLDTRTPDFQKAIADWANSSRHIQRLPVTEQTPKMSWSSFWKTPTAFLKFSGKMKRHDALKILATVKERVRLHGSPLSLQLPSLKNVAVSSQARAVEIAKWILEGKSLPSDVQTALRRLTPEQKKNLAENVDLFSSGVSNLFRSLTTSTGSKEKILLIGEGAPVFADLLREHFPTRQIQTVSTSAEIDPTVIYDKLVVLNQLQHGPGDQQARQNLEKFSRSLKPNGRAFFVDMFQDQKAKPVSQMLMSFALDAFQNGAPMTETELALSLALRKQTLQAATQIPLQSAQLLDRAEAAGFQTDIRYGNFEGEEIFGGKWIQLRKRSP